MWTPYFVNLNNDTFQLKTLLFFVHLRSQQRIEKVISNYQIYSVAILTHLTCILRVAIVSNIQKVNLQRQQRQTDDADTRRWRRSQQTGPVSKVRT